MDKTPIINGFNEWDPLEEVIVGSALHARFPYHDKGLNHLEPEARSILESTTNRSYPDWIIEESEEDINEFIRVLEKLNITVRRPEPVNYDGIVKTPLWESDCFFHYAPRDIMLTVGNQIIESPCAFRSRQFETAAYRSILIDYLKQGGRWISAPKPTLKDEVYITDENGKHILNETEPIFDAANVLRCGKDLIYLVSRSGNEFGAKWLQQTVGDEYRVHTCKNLYDGIHIDSTIGLLRPGLFLACPERVNSDNIPKPLKNWDIIYAPEMKEVAYSNYKELSSKWIGMNLLMLSPNLAVVDADQVELIKVLEKHKIDCIPLRLRHGKILAGGFHCITVDVRRRGVLEDYSS